MKNILSLSTLLFLLLSSTIYGQTRIYPPNLRAPINGEQGQATDITVDWDAVTGETLNITYELQMATDAEFTDAVVFDRTAFTALQMYSLLFGQKYYWRVKAFDDDTPSDWSEVWSFTTASMVHFKTTPGPAIGDMVYANPFVSWDKLTGLTSYQLQVDTTSGFAAEISGTNGVINATFVTETGDKWVVGDDGLVLHFEDGQWITLDAGTTEDLNGVFFVSETDGYIVGNGGIVIHFDGSSWSTVDVGTTEDLNAISFFDANSGWVVGVGGITIKFSSGVWTIETTDNTNDLTDVFAINPINVWACGKSKTVVHFDGAAWISEEIGSKDYYSIWFVNEDNGYVVGKSGKIFHFNGTEWIEQVSGTTKDLYSLSFSDGIGYAVGKSGTMLMFNGEWVTMASGFDDDLLGSYSGGGQTIYGGKDGFLSASTDGGFNSPYVKNYNVPFDSGSYQLASLLFGKTFYYRIRAINELDQSEWSGPWSMTTYNAPDLVAPSNNSSNNDLDQLFKWEEYEGATDYVYQIGVDENFATSWSVPLDSNSVDFTIALFGHEYFWRVNAVHPEDISDWSEVWTFTTLNTVTLESPEDNMEDVNSCPKFNWEEINGVAEFEIAIALDEDFTNPTTMIVEENFMQCQETMQKNTVYYWKVRAISSQDTSGWSAAWSFKTEGYIGFEDYFTKYPIQVYPNPSNGDFAIVLNSFSGEIYTLSVTDIAGKVLMEKDVVCFPGENKVEISLGKVEKGIYLVNVSQGEERTSKKLFIQ